MSACLWWKPDGEMLLLPVLWWVTLGAILFTSWEALVESSRLRDLSHVLYTLVAGTALGTTRPGTHAYCSLPFTVACPRS